MKIFILEDSEERIKSFKERLLKHDLTICKDNNTEAHTLIKNNSYDLIMLDHDLGGLHHVDSTTENTGYQFVLFLVNNTLQYNAVIVIHSMDNPGSSAMYNLLKRNDYDVQRIPFNVLKLEGK